MSDLPSTEIVSRIYRTAAGDAWVERDERGRLWLRCGDHLYASYPGMAPALAALVKHTEACRPGEESIRDL